MIDVIKEGIKKEIEALNSILENVNIKKIESFVIDPLKEKKLNLNLPKGESFIYIIKSIKPIEQQIIIKGIEEGKKKDFAMCRINDNFGVNKENCLYVGSSHDIVKRLQEHIGIGGYQKTYAMHLAKWWEYGPITIEIYSVGDNEYLQLFEDILWDYYKPILGRQGKK